VAQKYLVDLVNQIFDIRGMKTVATHEAKTHLSALLKEVSAGQTVVITCGRKPLAKLVPYEVAAERPRVGDMLDEPFEVSEEALRPMSKAELGGWGL
jgi:prevent-host-death family protein